MYTSFNTSFNITKLLVTFKYMEYKSERMDDVSVLIFIQQRSMILSHDYRKAISMFKDKLQ